jgi:hypothetical protein
MAQCRGVIPRGGTFGLADYSKELLGRTMEKDLQTSDWSRSNLSSQQQLYAAKDVIYALRINNKLQSLPDISLPLDENDAVAGIKIVITPHRGSKSAVSTLAARGEIVDAAPESVTLGFKLSRRSRGEPYYCVVRIDEVVAGSLKVQTVKNGNKQATLREFGSTPFNIILQVPCYGSKEATATSLRTLRRMIACLFRLEQAHLPVEETSIAAIRMEASLTIQQWRKSSEPKEKSFSLHLRMRC